MTKKDLKLWLEDKKRAAVCAVKEKGDKALKECTEKIYEEIGLDETATKIQTLLNEAEKILLDWKGGIAKEVAHPDCYYGTLYNRLLRYTAGADATKTALMENDLDVKKSKAYEKIKKRIDEERANVEQNYDNVIRNVSSLKNAKLGIEYLETLGFNLDEIMTAGSKPLETALSVPIDTKYLFVGGKAE